MASNPYNSRKQFDLNGQTYNYYDLKALEDAGQGKISRLPFSIRILLESLLRQHDGRVIKDEHVESLANWGTSKSKGKMFHLNLPV